MTLCEEINLGLDCNEMVHFFLLIDNKYHLYKYTGL